MAEALVRHDELIADCVAAHGGRLIGSMGEGDSTVSVFDSAPDAVAAALDGHAGAGGRAVARRPAESARGSACTPGRPSAAAPTTSAQRSTWPRACAAQADGGQIFLSAVTADLVARHLPAGCTLVDLGPHRLAGVAAPERLHALKGPGVSAPLPGAECPYRGLLAFEPEDRAFFFGREDVVGELIERLAPGRLFAVVGASGSGKSSVLRAGVIAAVRAGEVPGMRRARLLTPGVRPEPPTATTIPRELIVVDQFEELFTLCDDADRRLTFIDALLSTSCPVIIGVRADMYGRLGAHPELARAVAAKPDPAGRDERRRSRAGGGGAGAPGRATARAGLGGAGGARRGRGAGGAAAVVTRATGDVGASRRPDAHGRTATGRAAGSGPRWPRPLTTCSTALPPERRQLMRNMFVRLTEFGDDSVATRRRVRTDELVPDGVSSEVVDTLLKRLADARLLTLGEGTAEVAHEVLIREWPTLRRWLEEDREGIRLHRQLGDAARMWEAGGREPSDLYRGPRLVAATDWVRAHRPELNASERSFIDASVARGGPRAPLSTPRQPPPARAAGRRRRAAPRGDAGRRRRPHPAPQRPGPGAHLRRRAGRRAGAHRAGTSTVPCC